MGPTATCDGCTLNFSLAEAETTVHAYKYLPWMGWIGFTCPRCRKYQERWLHDRYAQILEAFTNQTDVSFEYEEAPDDEIIESFNKRYGFTTPQEYSATKRHEELITRLGLVLESIPDDLLWGELTDPELPRELPERWIDD